MNLQNPMKQMQQSVRIRRACSQPLLLQIANAVITPRCCFLLATLVCVLFPLRTCLSSDAPAPNPLPSEPTDAALAPELILGRLGRTDYQIVLPSRFASEQIGTGLREAARLLQAAFAANRVEIPVVMENERDPQRPGIFLGATGFAAKSGVDLSSLKGYDYIHKAVGADIILAGNDAVSKVKEEGVHWLGPMNLDRVATVKAVADFARDYVGTRFLFAEFGPHLTSSTAIDFLKSPGIEFLPTAPIAAPSNLDKHWKASLYYNLGFSRNRTSIFHLANNFYPTFNELWNAHTYHSIVPQEKYFDTNPELFALINGQRYRAKSPQDAQYDIGNPRFQEMVYEWLASTFDSGFERAYLGHPDAFRPSESKESYDLYGTGNDWSEKLWIFNRNMAERLYKSHPDKTIVLMAYGLTETPPKSFHRFPPNTMLMTTGTNEKDFELWKDFEIPKGFTTYLYNWVPNYCSPFAPMTTPASIEKQVRRLHSHNVRGIFCDGSGYPIDTGLEGPCIYVYGRMWDDPANLNADSLVTEFIEAAFREAAVPMSRFYDSLYRGIAVYADYLATRMGGFGQMRDGFQVLGFLYPPRLLTELDEHLTQAEKLAQMDKVKARLALVRRQFDWLRSTVDVIHLYHVHATAPDDEGIRTRLLDAIDKRNAGIASLYEKRNERDWATKPHPDWNTILFPPEGALADALTLALPGYLSNFNTSALTWNTAAMRALPPASIPRTVPRRIAAPPTINDPVWHDIEPVSLGSVPSAASEPGAPAPKVRSAYGQEALYLLFECPVAQGEDSVEVVLAAQPGKKIFHRFRVGANGGRSEAATGLITDKMNLLLDREDEEWSGLWNSEVHVDAKTGRWLALLTIPYATLGVDAPVPGAMHWRANFRRFVHVPGSKDAGRQWLWSGATSVEDPAALGVIDFAPLSEQDKAHVLRETGGYDKIPAEWASLPDPLPAEAREAWRIQLDPADQGLRQSWQSSQHDDSKWDKIRVPAWYAETDIGPYNGIAWYRMRFRVPEDWKGRDLRILFAAVDKEAWVYLNGRLLREHTEESEGRKAAELYDSAFEAVAPAADVIFGGENVLAVRVRNTVAGGGISRPLFIHAADPSLSREKARIQ